MSVTDSETCKTSNVRLPPGRWTTHAVRGVSFDVRQGRDRCACWRERFGQVCDGAVTVQLLGDSAAMAGSITYDGAEMVGAMSTTCARARQRHQLYFPRTDDVAEPAAHDGETIAESIDCIRAAR